jgi:hypothetical protein
MEAAVSLVLGCVEVEVKDLKKFKFSNFGSKQTCVL